MKRRKSFSQWTATMGGFVLYEMLDFWADGSFRERFLYQHFARQHNRGGGGVNKGIRLL